MLCCWLLQENSQGTMKTYPEVSLILWNSIIFWSPSHCLTSPEWHIGLQIKTTPYFTLCFVSRWDSLALTSQPSSNQPPSLIGSFHTTRSFGISSMDFRSKWRGFELHLHHLLAAWLWISYLTSLGLSFFYCKMEIILMFISYGYCEDEMSYSMWSSWFITSTIYILLSLSLFLFSWHVGLLTQAKQKLLSLPLMAVCSPPWSSATPAMIQTSLLAAGRSMEILLWHFECFFV